MPEYQYLGINQSGRRVQSFIQAANEQDLEKKLDVLGIDLISCKEKEKSFLSNLRKPKVTRRDIIIITTQFRQLLGAGVPLMEILEDLKSTYESDVVREMLASIHEDMEGGAVFSEALKPYESSFGIVYLSMVEVGEQTGQLDQILRNLEAMMKWEEEISAKAKKVMVYPAIVGLVVIGVVVMMMVFVVPELMSFIKEMEGEVSFATEALIATSEFFQEYILHLMVAPFIIWFLMKWLIKESKDVHMAVDEWVFKAPMVGQVIYKLKIARIASTLGVMYAAGVNFTEALRMATNVAGNVYLEAKVEEAIHYIEEGKEIHEAFRLAEVFPSMGLRMVKVGEISGNMDEALHNVSEYYDGEAKELIDKIEPAIEPIMTIIMAVVVGWVMMAVLGPIYDTISQVQ